MSHESSLQSLRDALTALQQRQTTISAFCTSWRNQSALLDALPEKYRLVMEDLLGRLEAGSLFTEESCSFSQEDLHTHLAVWLDKASAVLGSAQAS